MILKRIAPLTLGKVFFLLYGLMGLLIGALFSLASVLGAFAAAANSDGNKAWGLLFGVGAIVILPIFYGVLGGISGLIMAFLYNLVARMAGGVEVEFEPKTAV